MGPRPAGDEPKCIVTDPFDVIVLGEVLVEVTTRTAISDGVEARLAFSGDALNVAAAASAAGAAVGLVAVVSDDGLGDAIADTLRGLGVSDRLLLRRPGQQGVYINHSDPAGAREFYYARTMSVGSTLGPEDLDLDELARCGAVVASGVAGSISASARHAVTLAARAAGRFAYDPNFRPQLTSPDSARSLLRDLAPHAWLVTPSSPHETHLLLGSDDPSGAAHSLLTMGAANVAVTCGAVGVHYAGQDGDLFIPAAEAASVVDQTGAGDAFLGTTVAVAVLGATMPEAIQFGVEAAAAAVGSAGGRVLPADVGSGAAVTGRTAGDR